MSAVISAVLLPFALVNLFAQEPEFGKYESWEHQLHFQHTRDSGGIQLVKNILEVCGAPTQKLGDISLQENPYIYIEVDEFCCDISLKK